MQHSETHSVPPALTFRRVVWFLPVVFALHITEEWPHFTEWAQHYASAQFTQSAYTFIHLSGLAGNVLLAALFSRWRNRVALFLFFSAFLLPTFFWNIGFHVGATVLFGVYCPGVITALFLYPPVVCTVVRRALEEDLLSVRSCSVALVIGGFVHCWEVGHDVFNAW